MKFWNRSILPKVSLIYFGLNNLISEKWFLIYTMHLSCWKFAFDKFASHSQHLYTTESEVAWVKKYIPVSACTVENANVK